MEGFLIAFESTFLPPLSLSLSLSSSNIIGSGLIQQVKQLWFKFIEKLLKNLLVLYLLA